MKLKTEDQERKAVKPKDWSLKWWMKLIIESRQVNQDKKRVDTDY